MDMSELTARIQKRLGKERILQRGRMGDRGISLWVEPARLLEVARTLVEDGEVELSGPEHLSLVRLGDDWVQTYFFPVGSGAGWVAIRAATPHGGHLPSLGALGPRPRAEEARVAREQDVEFAT